LHDKSTHSALTQKIVGLLKITRPVNSLIIGLSVLIGAIIGNYKLLLNLDVFLLIISVVFISSAGHAINDVIDKDIDAINKPYRPIPSGIVTPKEAKIFSVALFCIGTGIASFVSILSLIIAGLASLLLYAYATHLKRKGFLGNLAIALLAFLTFIYGGTATTVTPLLLFPGYFALILALGREILKGIEDIEGDRKEGIETIAVKYGVKSARIVSTFLLSLLVITSELPYFLGYTSSVYLLIAALGVDLPIVISLYLMHKNNINAIITARRLTKYAMLFGVLAFIVDVLI